MGEDLCFTGAKVCDFWEVTFNSSGIMIFFNWNTCNRNTLKQQADIKHVFKN